MTRNVTIKTWYVVSGTAGATVKSEDGTVTFCTIPEGGQGYFYATADKVVTSDDSVKITEATFNRAATALGLLGGGVKSELPAGYLRAEFLESTDGASNKRITLPAWFDPSVDSVKIKTEHNGFLMNRFSAEGIYRPKGFAYGHYMPWEALWLTADKWGYKAGFVDMSDGQYHVFELASTPAVHSFYVDGEMYHENNEDLSVVSGQAFSLFGTSVDAYPFAGKKKYWRLEVNGKNIADLMPCVDAGGKPCMLNKVDSIAHYAESGLVAGFTLEQARKLGAHLPEGGGALTISLPTGYEQDAAVAESLEAARAKGWTLTVQTYEAETEVATFGMRRIWVRRVQDEQGAYVDADGLRWAVDWCVDLVTPDGSTPDEHGYELYRSTEAAVAYWELTAWVDPEQEDLLLNQTTENGQ